MVVVEVRQGAGGEETRRGEEKRGEEEEEKEEDEEEEEEDEEEATDIKSNNPHLAGGEKNYVFLSLRHKGCCPVTRAGNRLCPCMSPLCSCGILISQLVKLDFSELI